MVTHPRPLTSSITTLLCAALVALGPVLSGCPDEPVGPSELDDDFEADAGGDAQEDVGSGHDATTGEDGAADQDAAVDTDSPAEDAGGQDAGEPDVNVDPGGGSIAIFLAGDLTPANLNDGLSGQTPTNYAMGLSRYEILRSASDPSPTPCFDHGDEPRVAELAGDTLMGSCPTQGVPTAVYTHGRVKLDWVRYTVTGTLHAVGRTLPAQFTFFRAYSDTTYEGVPYRANHGWVRFQGITQVELPQTFPDAPDPPGFHSQKVGGEFLLTFPYLRPLPVVEDDPGEHWARFHWHIHEAFRWEDQAHDGFVDGTWDVSPPPGQPEPVRVFGATGYHITTSLD